MEQSSNSPVNGTEVFSTNVAWGYHIMVDAAGLDDRIKDKANVEKFATTLVKNIDMVAYGKPRVVHFGEGDKEGFTLVQLIETSSITAHFVNNNGTAYFDVFSCKPFEQKAVIDTIKEFFGGTNYNHTFLHRQAPEV